MLHGRRLAWSLFLIQTATGDIGIGRRGPNGLLAHVRAGSAASGRAVHAWTRAGDTWHYEPIDAPLDDPAWLSEADRLFLSRATAR